MHLCVTELAAAVECINTHEYLYAVAWISLAVVHRTQYMFAFPLGIHRIRPVQMRIDY